METNLDDFHRRHDEDRFGDTCPESGYIKGRDQVIGSSPQRSDSNA